MLKIQQDLYKPPNNSKITNNNNNNWIHKTKIELDLPSLICLEEKTCSNEFSRRETHWHKDLFFMAWLWSNDNFLSHLQEVNEVPTNPIQDSRANLLEEGGNDTVQPCDTTQEGLDLNFGVKLFTVQFYAIEHNSKSNRWIELKLYQKIPEVLLYVGVKLTSLTSCLSLWNFLIANTFLQQQCMEVVTDKNFK